MMQVNDTFEQIKNAGIIAMMRGQFSIEYYVEVAKTLSSVGVCVLEVTLNSPDALKAIASLRREMGESMLIGAGTVRSVTHARVSLAAGAQFLVSPNLDLPTLTFSKNQRVLHLPGIFTATEAATAHTAGCRLVKLFPADLLGPAYLKALRAPLDDVDFVPTGGITPGNIGAYAQAGAAAVGVGSALIAGSGQSLEDLHTRGKELIAAWRSVRNG